MTRKILVFEFITGGGFSQKELPASLAREGLLMLRALVNDLAIVANIHLTIILDWRIKDFIPPVNSQVITLSSNECVYDLLPELIKSVDLIWPIAPEMGDELQKITQLVEQNFRQLLNSSSQAIAICSDKLATIQCLNKQSLIAIEAMQLDEFLQQFPAPWVVKPKDGVGCLNSYFISNQSELFQIKNQISQLSDYLIQPYIKGVSQSLSCLFRQGKGWLVCCNEQLVSIADGTFELEACLVNVASRDSDIHQSLINTVANIIPGLYGYVGIDIIQQESGKPMVLEINPRLTTSYVGVSEAIGVNVAKAVIEMSEAPPVIVKVLNKQVMVSTSQ